MCSLRYLAISMLLGQMLVLAGCGREGDDVSESLTEEPKQSEPIAYSTEPNSVHPGRHEKASGRYRFVETWRSGSEDEAVKEFVELWAVVEGEPVSVNFISPLSEAEFVGLPDARREALRPGLMERATLLGAVIRKSLARAEEEIETGDDREAEKILLAVEHLAVVLNSPDALLFSRRIGAPMEARAISRLVEMYAGMPDQRHKVESLRQRLEMLAKDALRR